MRPLPRLLAFADDRIAALGDLGVRAAAIAAAGPAVGLVARLPGRSTDRLATLALRFVALATPPMASVFVTGRSDVAAATGAHGVILRKQDLCHPDAERSEGEGSPSSPRLTIASSQRAVVTGSEIPRYARDDIYLVRSVHTLAEAESAAADGADALVVGAIWPTSTHPDRVAAGTVLLRDVVALGVPTFAIGGVTPARAVEARGAGAWGVAAITALWDADDPYAAAMEMLQPWS